MTWIAPAASLAGDLAVPGDKSISHRSLLLGALAEGTSRVRGFGASQDTLATARAVSSLGARVELGSDLVLVEGVGLRGLRPPGQPIDCANAGTLLRLLAGILAGQSGEFELVGDESLSRRPLGRIALPLRSMGAQLEMVDGHAPLRIRGGMLQPVRHELPVASAQVKSCVLLAGLFAEGGPTTVVEPIPTRDHTERMLVAAGVRVHRRGQEISIWPVERLAPLDLDVPGDFSSAAPFIVAATVVLGSELRIHGVNVNPTRTGLLDALERMGARISLFNRRKTGGEPVADIEVVHAELVATEVGPEEVPRMVDELPLFALAAGFARGESVVRGAQELRVKESDRIETVTGALRALGIRVSSYEDGIRVRGVPSRPRGGGVIESEGDHRIAMLGAVGALASREGAQIEGAEAVAVSFPEFFPTLELLRRR